MRQYRTPHISGHPSPRLWGGLKNSPCHAGSQLAGGLGARAVWAWAFVCREACLAGTWRSWSSSISHRFPAHDCIGATAYPEKQSPLRQVHIDAVGCDVRAVDARRASVRLAIFVFLRYTKYEARSSWYEVCPSPKPAMLAHYGMAGLEKKQVINVLKRTVFAVVAIYDDHPNQQVSPEQATALMAAQKSDAGGRSWWYSSCL